MTVNMYAALVCAASALAAVAFWLTILPRLLIVGRWCGSKYLQILKRYTRQPAITSLAARAVFQSSLGVQTGPYRAHSHPESAGVRTSASGQLTAIAREMGYEPYYVQLSESDVRAGRAGCRTWYWGKDVGVEVAPFDPPVDSAVCLVDVDQYIDMPNMLASWPRQYLISTFQPTTVAHSAGEYSFTFLRSGECDYRVSGGAKYVHHVWNYEGDVLVVSDGAWLRPTTTVYAVDRRQSDAHHQVVCLSPMACFTGVLWVPYLAGAPLQRLHPIVGDFLRMDAATKEGVKRSTGRVGAFHCAVVPVAIDDAVAAVARLSTVPLSLAQVRQTADVKCDAAAAALVEYHRAKTTAKTPMVYPVDESVNRYQFGRYEPEEAPSMIPFMAPLIHGCYAPDLTRGNEEQCIQGRVKDVASQQDVTPWVSKCMDEFLELAMPVAHQAQPKDIPEVYARQNRPTQVSILNRAGMTTAVGDSAPHCDAMLKREAYQKPTDPRNITIIPDVTKANFSRYTYTFAEWLKEKRWYAFSKTPAEVAERVAEICMGAQRSAMKSDHNRMDGHVSPAARALEHRAYLRLFARQYHEELLEIISRQFGRQGRTRHGVKYDIGWSRMSGVPSTSNDNTLLAAFCAYLAYRKMGLSPAEAYAKLGLYGGDDGLSADLDPTCYVAAGHAMGQVITAEPIPRFARGVMFLSRYYSPYVWSGSPNSMCDLRRTLSKFHTTHRLPPNVTALHKLREKCSGYVLCDGNTPVVGVLCRLVLGKFGAVTTDYGVKPYAAYAGSDADQYPNLNEGEWMWDEFRAQLPQFDHATFEGWVLGVRTDGCDVLRPPMCCNDPAEVLPKVPAVINGANVAPAAAVPAAAEARAQVRPQRPLPPVPPVAKAPVPPAAGTPQRRRNRRRRQPP